MYNLFQYQKEGASWLASKKYCLLADEMGLGKSAQAITAADLLAGLPILILCPAVARINWMREWQKFSSRTLNFCVVLSAVQAPSISQSDVTICSYDLTTQPAVMSALSARRWKVLVLDEAHYLKEPDARRTASVFGGTGLVHTCDKVWCLTGTPAPNNPGELWAMLYCLGVIKLSYLDFLDRYTKQRPTKFGSTVYGGKNLYELKAKMAPFMLRRMKEEVMPQLPPIRFNEYVVEPSKVDKLKWSIYFDNYLFNPAQFDKDIDKAQRLVDGLLENLGTGADSMKILEGLNGRPEVKSLRRWTGLQKVPAVIDLIAQELTANAYDKIVLFAVHRDVIEELEYGLKKFGSVKIYGGTPAIKRDKIIKRFQTDKRCRVFVGQTVAAGTAITLTAASEVGVVEADWTPANNQQAIMRCHRIGQTKTVNVRFFSTPGFDERVSRVLKQKTKTLADLFDGPKILAEGDGRSSAYAAKIEDRIEEVLQDPFQ